ncbi:MAG: DNA-binding response regulator [Alteromonadaceae bacterium]|nr:MAG: DNA-binding response regulator [Alteromonadaceae bacterium]
MTEAPTPSDQHSVLIIEDDSAIIRGLKDSYSRKKYQVYTAMDGEQALEIAFSTPVDLILLDIMLPKINGFDVCAQIREAQIDTPIIMLTAKGHEDDIVRGLNLGADDYVTKPFSINQLHARSQAFIRRHAKSQTHSYHFGDFNLCTQTHRLTRHISQERQEKQETQAPIKLTPKEYNMLAFFLSRAGHALTRETLLNAVWRNSLLTTERSVDRCVTTLRKKIETNPRSPKFIQSIRDVGYRFVID